MPLTIDIGDKGGDDDDVDEDEVDVKDGSGSKLASAAGGGPKVLERSKTTRPRV